MSLIYLSLKRTFQSYRQEKSIISPKKAIIVTFLILCVLLKKSHENPSKYRHIFMCKASFYRKKVFMQGCFNWNNFVVMTF